MHERASESSTLGGARRFRLAMPQMALGGLSETFLLKELGDLHWSLLAKAFGTPTEAFLDSEGNRLYATFARVRWWSTHPLSSFEEGDELEVSSTLHRAGNRLFVSKVVATTSRGAKLQATLLSTFAKRNASGALVKGVPRSIHLDMSEDQEALDFARDYVS